MRSCIHCGTQLVPDPVRRDWAYCPTHSPEHAAWATLIAQQARQARVRPELMDIGKPGWPHRG